MRLTSSICKICRATEKVVKDHKNVWVKEELEINEKYISLIKGKCENVLLLTCCNIRGKNRCKGTTNHLRRKSAYTCSYNSPLQHLKNI